MSFLSSINQHLPWEYQIQYGLFFKWSIWHTKFYIILNRIILNCNPLFTDVRSIPFHAGETITLEPSTQSQGLSVLESLAIGVCVLMLIFVYAAGIVFYIHYKQRQKRKKNKDLEMNRNNNGSDDGSGMGSMIDMDNIVSIPKDNEN